MTISATIALRGAVRATLESFPPLLDRLGGAKVFEEAPPNAEMPYVSFGDVRSRDWSTSSDTGAEHALIIDVWTQHHGPAAALEVSQIISESLAAATITMIGHKLISILEQSIETRREANGRAWRSRQNFRVITENICFKNICSKWSPFMSAQRGKDLILKVDDGTNAMVSVAGLRTQRLALNADAVDITNQESSGRWRELLAGAGVRRASIAGTGIFKDATSDAMVRQIFFDGLIRRWQVIVPSFGIIEGVFQISSLDYRGEYSAEVTFELALESAGELTFTAL